MVLATRTGIVQALPGLQLMLLSAAMSTRGAHTLSLIIGSAISVIFLSVKLVTAHEYCMYNYVIMIYLCRIQIQVLP